MASKSSTWTPGPSVCRCCLSDGCYKDISTEYFYLGKREVYSEMLYETFDLNISFSEQGPNSNSRLICEPCISRLRDACDFKRQVIKSEKTFLEHLAGGSGLSGLSAGQSSDKCLPDTKLWVKLEAPYEDEEEDNCASAYVDDDDLDDEPLTKLASKVPKKESVDITDLIDNSKPTTKRKSTTKIKVIPKKAKKVESEPSVSAANKIEKKKKENEVYNTTRRNAEYIVKYSTAYPFRIPEGSMVCVYCAEAYDDPSKYRDHMNEEHRIFNLRTAFAHVSDCYLKVDCTELRCRICNVECDNLDSIAKHLSSRHFINIDNDYDFGLQPFNIFKDKFVCVICNWKSITMRELSKHMSCHYLKYTCDTCGKSYSTSTALYHHVRLSHATIGEQRICRKCRKIFNSAKEKLEHVKLTLQCWPYVCSICDERFLNWNPKQTHLMEVHGAKPKTYTCNECSEVFSTRHKLRNHFVVAHTDYNFTCVCCDLKFSAKKQLEEHRVVHTKEKSFECTYCSKSFSRKKNLNQHLWIHREVKRFSCTACNKFFNQRVSWKTHMKSYHSDLSEVEFGDGKNNLKFLLSVPKKDS